MSSSESHSPRLQTARPLVGVWGLSQNIFCFPRKSNGASDVPATQQRQILDAMPSSLSNPGRLDSFPSPHRFPHNSGWCVTGKHRPWLLAADPNICLRATRCLQSRVGSTHASVGLLMSLSCTGVARGHSFVTPPVNRHTCLRHIWRQYGERFPTKQKTAQRLLVINTSETSRCTKVFVVSFYSYKKPENEKLPFTWE